MIPYFGKNLCSIAQEIRYTLVNVIAFSIFQLKLKTFVRITVAVHKSSSPLRSSGIMKGKVTSSLKPPLTKNSSEVGYWKLNKMPGSGGCLRQKKLIGYLR